MNINYKYYNWGPLFLKMDVAPDLIDELNRDISSCVEDYRPHLAGIIEQEYKFTDSLQEKYYQLLQPYISCYLNTFVNDWKPDLFDNADIDIRPILESMWVNKMKAGEYNPLHCHDGSLSFVIYTDVPDIIATEISPSKSPPPGSISFFNTVTPATGTQNTLSIDNMLSSIDDVNLQPKTGEMLVFPSYLSHSVQSYTSDVERVSVSGNFKFI